MTLILCYCIPRGIRSQKVFIFPYFYPPNSQKGAKRATYSNFFIIKTTNAIATKILHSDKDHYILVVGRPKICPTNPTWQPPSWTKMDKLLYFSNCSTDFDEILRADAYWPTEP